MSSCGSGGRRLIERRVDLAVSIPDVSKDHYYPHNHACNLLSTHELTLLEQTESAPEDTPASSAQVQHQTRVSAMPSPATNFGAEGNTKMSNGVSDDANMKDLDLDLGNFASVWDGSFPTLMGIDLDDFNFDSTAFQ